MKFWRLCRQRGQTTLLVTHDQSEALNLADRLVVMNQGRIEQNDIPQRIVAQPATLFAAQLYRRASDQSVDSPQRCSSIDLSAFANSLAGRRGHCGDRVRPQQLRARRLNFCFGGLRKQR